MDKKRIDEIKEKAFESRCLTINEIASFGSGHIGGAMSISDLLALLYFDVMNVDPKNPGKEDRDRLVVSKGQHTHLDFNRVCNILSEYGSSEKYVSSREAYLEEHFSPLIREHALQALSQL